MARSHRVAIPAGIDAIGMHRITWPQMGLFIRHAVGAMLPATEAMPANALLVLQEAMVPYRMVSRREYPHRLAA